MSASAQQILPPDPRARHIRAALLIDGEVFVGVGTLVPGLLPVVILQIEPRIIGIDLSTSPDIEVVS